MITENQILSIGSITRLHGTKGELQCLLTNDLFYDANPDFIVLQLDNIAVPFRLLDWREKGTETILITLKGINSEQQAIPLIGAEIFLLRKDIPADQETSTDLTWQDLVGYHIYNADMQDMGIIRSVDEQTANILALTDTDNLYPLHEDLILALDTEQHTIQLNVIL